MLGGRKTIRTVLYMSMLSTIQCSERFGAFYRILVAKGKHKKVALAACMRKMITVLNAMIRDECDWCESQIFLVVDIIILPIIKLVLTYVIYSDYIRFLLMLSISLI